ncbi:tapasin-related protein [Gouania willdenowi]|uniref:Ig-like domain-containing protein n=1 Tax=Gouania willdenowi TaxID=441366 RepID=A0A8C5I2A3_GOUWI|nr:tapasin-related protein [Gouania willdenowi]
MIQIILLGYFMMCVCAAEVVDIVLSCTLVEEGSGLGGNGGSSLFGRTPVTLVLRDIEIGSDQSPDTLTPFFPPLVPNPDLIVFETKVSTPGIFDAHVLLHAECNDQEVTCEISLYSPPGSQKGSDPAHFLVSLNIKEVDFSTTLILQTLTVEKNELTLIQNKLGLPLSQTGTVLTKLIFVVFSNVKFVSALVHGDTVLYCGFKQPAVPLGQEVTVEWRLQHRGKGKKVVEMKTKLDDKELNPEVHSERKDSSLDADGLRYGNASVTLNKLKVLDEGTYICTVGIGQFFAQQVIQLKLFQSPYISLSEDKLVLESPHTLICHCSKFYPLDAQMEWFTLSPTDTEPKPFPQEGSLSGHRQHGDGTFSQSSQITVQPTLAPGTKVTCRVTHEAFDSPVHVSATVQRPDSDSYWWFLGFLIITVLFFYQVMR